MENLEVRIIWMISLGWGADWMRGGTPPYYFNDVFNSQIC